MEVGNFMMKSLTIRNPRVERWKTRSKTYLLQNGQLKDKYYNKNGEIDGLRKQYRMWSVVVYT